MARLKVPTKKLTYEEFLEWGDEDTWAEWVDREVLVLSPANPQLLESFERALSGRGKGG